MAKLTRVTSWLTKWTSSLVGAVERLIVNKLEDVVDVKDFGVVGDGVTDDSVAFNKAISAARTARKTLYLGNNTIYCASPDTWYGRCVIRGNGKSKLIGNYTYSDTFPVSADTTAVLDDDMPFVEITGVNWRSNDNNKYSLTVIAQGGFSFLDTVELTKCKFYGKRNFLGKNLISGTADKCWFYGVYVGIELQGCTNWNITSCWFRNARKKAVYLTYNPDFPSRIGGENIRFLNCEFAVCAVGIYAYRAVWLNVDNCLFDYCTLPVYGPGSYYAKVSNSYLGAADQGSLRNFEGFENPPTRGTSLYFHGLDADSVFPSPSYCGVTVVNCELVNYLNGTTNPIAIVNGYINESVYLLGRHTTFLGNKLIMLQAHSATTLLSLNHNKQSTVSSNSFVSPNLSTTLLSPYISSNAGLHNGGMNNSNECTQGGVVVEQQYDFQSLSGIRSIKGLGVFLQDDAGTNKVGVNASGRFCLVNADVSLTASAGGGSLPSGGPAGFFIMNINGGNVKVPYYPL